MSEQIICSPKVDVMCARGLPLHSVSFTGLGSPMYCARWNCRFEHSVGLCFHSTLESRSDNCSSWLRLLRHLHFCDRAANGQDAGLYLPVPSSSLRPAPFGSFKEYFSQEVFDETSHRHGVAAHCGSSFAVGGHVTKSA